MKFNDLAWGAVCFYYHSAGDKRYGGIMKDTGFLSRLRTMPQTLTEREFEEKAIDSFINIENRDLLVSHQLSDKILKKIIELNPEISTLADVTLLEVNLNEPRIFDAIINTYAELRAYGLWITGASKIAHLLNDQLFPLLSPPLARYFNITDNKDSIKSWLARIQGELAEATTDFRAQGIPGAPDRYLSNHLSYGQEGYTKSLLKYVDEYYWLKFADGLPVPPRWTPACPATNAAVAAYTSNFAPH